MWGWAPVGVEAPAGVGESAGRGEAAAQAMRWTSVYSLKLEGEPTNDRDELLTTLAAVRCVRAEGSGCGRVSLGTEVTVRKDWEGGGCGEDGTGKGGRQRRLPT